MSVSTPWLLANNVFKPAHLNVLNFPCQWVEWKIQGTMVHSQPWVSFSGKDPFKQLSEVQPMSPAAHFTSELHPQMWRCKCRSKIRAMGWWDIMGYHGPRMLAVYVSLKLDALSRNWRTREGFWLWRNSDTQWAPLMAPTGRAIQWPSPRWCFLCPMDVHRRINSATSERSQVPVPPSDQVISRIFGVCHGNIPILQPWW